MGQSDSTDVKWFIVIGVCAVVLGLISGMVIGAKIDLFGLSNAAAYREQRDRLAREYARASGSLAVAEDRAADLEQTRGRLEGELAASRARAIEAEGLAERTSERLRSAVVAIGTAEGTVTRAVSLVDKLEGIADRLEGSLRGNAKGSE